MRLRDGSRSRFGEETIVPLLSDQMRFKRRARQFLAAANAARGQGWRLIHAETTRTYDDMAAGQSAEDIENQTRSALAAWSNEGGSI